MRRGPHMPFSWQLADALPAIARDMLHKLQSNHHRMRSSGIASHWCLLVGLRTGVHLLLQDMHNPGESSSSHEAQGAEGGGEGFHEIAALFQSAMYRSTPEAGQGEMRQQMNRGNLADHWLVLLNDPYLCSHA